MSTTSHGSHGSPGSPAAGADPAALPEAGPGPGLPPSSAGQAPDSTALRLGYAGLLPFGVGAALVWLVVQPEPHLFVIEGLSAYAAVIASFLGGIHWGLGLRASPADPRRFVWGVVPSLVSWVAVLMPASAGLVVQGVLLIVCYAVDRKVYPLHGIGAWLTLRFRLTGVASLSCFLGAAGA